MKKFLSLVLLTLLALPIQAASASSDMEDIDLADFMLFEEGETWSYAYVTHAASDEYLDLIGYEVPEGEESETITLDEDTDWEGDFNTYTVEVQDCELTEDCYTLYYDLGEELSSDFIFEIDGDELVFLELGGTEINEVFFSLDGFEHEGLTVFTYMLMTPILQFFPTDSVATMSFETSCSTTYHEGHALWSNLDGYSADLLEQSCSVLAYNDEGDLQYEAEYYDYYIRDFGHYHTAYFIYDADEELLTSMSELLYETSIDLDEVLSVTGRDDVKGTDDEDEEAEEEEMEEDEETTEELEEEVEGIEEEEESVSIANPYTDLTISHPNYDAILWLSEWGVIDGYEDGTVAPNNSINRAELLKLLVEARYGTPNAADYNSCFTDVTDEWFAKYVCYAKEQEWVSGYEDGSFGPANAVLDVEAIKMLIEVYDIEIQESDALPYTDVDADQWYSDYILTAYVLGLLEEDGENYNPGTEQSRANVFENLYRLILISS